MSHYDSSISTLSKINKNRSVSLYRNTTLETLLGEVTASECLTCAPNVDRTDLQLEGVS